MDKSLQMEQGRPFRKKPEIGQYFQKIRELATVESTSVAKASKSIFLVVFAGLVLFISVAGKTPKANKVLGCWKLISGYLDNHGKQIAIFGSHPGGMVIFTEDLHFMVIIHNPDIPKFASGDRANGTPEEYKAAIMNSLGVYGTYAIDEDGEFLEQHVVGSTFQNMNGISRGRNELTEKVEGNRMMENLNIVWERIS
jgi:hypothetical protein